MPARQLWLEAEQRWNRLVAEEGQMQRLESAQQQKQLEAEQREQERLEAELRLKAKMPLGRDNLPAARPHQDGPVRPRSS